MAATLNKFASAEGGEAASPYTVTAPTGTVAGEAMFALGIVNPYSEAVEAKELTFTGGGTWTLLKEIKISGRTSVSLWWRRTEASEPSSYSLGWTGPGAFAQFHEAAVFTYKEVLTTGSPLTGTATGHNVGYATAGAAEALTTTAANSTVVHVMAGNGSKGSAPPSGFTHHALDGTDNGFYLSDTVQAAAGTTGTPTGTWAANSWISVFLFALAPGAATSGSQPQTFLSYITPIAN